MSYIFRKSYNLLVHVLLFQLILGITTLLPNLSYSNQLRGFLIKPFFKKCGKKFQIAKGATINMARNIEIGDNVYLAHNIWLNGTGGLKIGNNVVVSPNVVIASTKHKRVDGKPSLRYSELKEIVIGDGVWIASNSTISLGTKIGNGTIIGAGSAVTKDIPSNSFYAGVPAKKIKELL